MRTRTPIIASLLALAAACADRGATEPQGALAPSADPSRQAAGAAVGAVYTETNAADGNAVIAFDRAADGTLTPAGTFATGGVGIGGTTDPLVSQYALVLSTDRRFLYVVNAGSDDISVFHVGGAKRLELIQRIASGGVRPTSLALGHGTLYVLNAGSNAVAGFSVSNGRLTARPGWSRALSPNASGAAEVRFSPDGRLVVVSERLSATFDTFLANPDGSLGQAVSNPSSGLTPFGFDFTPRGRIVASEAGPGTVSSYSATNGILSVRTASTPTFQRAPCWLVVTPDGRYAYTANAGSGTISGFSVTSDGAISLLDPSGVSADLGAGSTPLDLETTDNGHFLYVLKAGTGTIGALAIGANGALTDIGDYPAVAPRSGQMGMAAF